MRLGILDTLGLATTLVFAIPAAVLGVEFVVGDRPLLGGTLLVVAVLMVVVPRVVTTPGDVPGTVAERVVGRVVEPPDENE